MLFVISAAEDIYVSGPVDFSLYQAVADYKGDSRELSLTEGQEVEVAHKVENGQ